MEVKGNGVDIIEISRIRDAYVQSQNFAGRVFTPRELDYCRGRNRWASLAARFAAKEAASKALGTGIGRVKWTDIEVVVNDSGRPEIRLQGTAAEIAERLGITNLALSMSHCKNYAVAFVIAY